MKHYLLSVITPTDGVQPPPEALDQIMGRVEDVTQECKAAGAWVFAGGLDAPSTATVVKANGHETLMTDGPFAEGKEYVGGFSVIKAPDLDVALEWGGKYSQAIGLPIEVRPFSAVREDL
jgi:hypothetical protein